MSVLYPSWWVGWGSREALCPTQSERLGLGRAPPPGTSSRMSWWLSSPSALGSAPQPWGGAPWSSQWSKGSRGPGWEHTVEQVSGEERMRPGNGAGREGRVSPQEWLQHASPPASTALRNRSTRAAGGGEEWPPICPRPAAEASPGHLLPAHRGRRDGHSPINRLLVLFYVVWFYRHLSLAPFPS